MALMMVLMVLMMVLVEKTKILLQIKMTQITRHHLQMTLFATNATQIALFVRYYKTTACYVILIKILNYPKGIQVAVNVKKTSLNSQIQ